MNKLEAVLHYGMTRADVPGPEDLRSLFFASVLGALVDHRETSDMSRALHGAYVAALAEQ